MAITAPGPVFRLLDESALYRVAVNVLKVVDEFLMVADVAVVMTPLPEGGRLCLVAHGFVAHVCLLLADAGLVVSRMQSSVLG